MSLSHSLIPIISRYRYRSRAHTRTLAERLVHRVDAAAAAAADPHWEREAEELLHWSAALDYDAYTQHWRTLATAGIPRAHAGAELLDELGLGVGRGAGSGGGGGGDGETLADRRSAASHATSSSYAARAGYADSGVHSALSGEHLAGGYHDGDDLAAAELTAHWMRSTSPSDAPH